MSSQSFFPKILLFVGVVVGAMFLSYMIDDNLEVGWPTNVVRNWQDFGLLHLHGQLTYNPGGFQVTDHPQNYNGMSPLFLYPVYFATKLFAWTGLGTVAFHVLLAAVVFWACWQLLGRDHFAMIVAAATLLCPGYLRWPKDFDPGALSVLPILPYAVIVLAILRKSKLTLGSAAVLLVLTLGMVSTNWTSAWAFAPFSFWVLAMPGINRRGMVFLFGVMVVAIPALALVSVAAKYGAAIHAGDVGSGGVFSNYTWGHHGYGSDLSTSRAFIRVGFTNSIGLFPLWLLIAYAVGTRIRNGACVSWRMFGPLAMAIADLIIMRNYFGHHPWMAGPVLIVGITFTLSLLRVPDGETKEQILFKKIPALAIGCFAYGFLVLMFLRANEINLLDLTKLVRDNTARSNTIVVAKSDSRTAAMAEKLEENLDRHVIVVNDLQELTGERDQWVVLSAVELDGSLTLAARSRTQQSWLTKTGDWFNHAIARRRAGDRLDASDSYFLYKLRPAIVH